MNLLKNVLLFSLGVGLGALALAATQKRTSTEKPAKPSPKTKPYDIVQGSSEDSFPASDPPSWNAPNDLH